MKNKSKATLDDDLQRLKMWLMKQPHLPKDVDDEILTGFIYGTKTLEIAKQKLDSYFSARSTVPQIFEFSERDASDPVFKKASSSAKKMYLTGVSTEGYRVIFNTLTPIFDDYFVHTQEIIRAMMMLELALYTWPDMTGIIMVYDMKGLNSSVITKFSPGTLASGLQWFQSAFPAKLKGVVVFNAPSFVEMLVQKLIKPFLKAKIYERILVTSEDESCLKNYIPQAVLPSDYGGLDKSSDELNDYWLDMLEQKRDWFKKTSYQMSDERKRPPDEKNTYGVEGTFRSLSID